MEITAKIARKFRLAALQAVDWWMTASDVEALCPPCAEKMREARITKVKASAVFGQDSQRILQARVAAWDKLPKGWTEESLKSFWGKMGGSGKHKVTACMDKMKGKIDDPGAFCASLADHFNGTGWRGKEASEDVKKLVQDAVKIQDKLMGWASKLTGSKQADPKAISDKMVAEGKKLLALAEKMPSDKKLKSMIKELKASIDRHESAASKDDNFGWLADIAQDAEEVVTAMNKVQSMDKKARNEFAETVMARSIVAKYVEKQGMEHDSPEARAKYLKDHPNADKANHTVKKTDKEEAKGEDKGEAEKDEGGKDEGGGKADVSGIKTEMTFGVMPKKEDFTKYVRNAIDPEGDDDEPFWPEGKPFNMKLVGDDKTVADNADLPSKFETPEEAYDGVKKIMDYADSLEDDDELREAAENLASSIMGRLGFDWI